MKPVGIMAVCGMGIKEAKELKLKISKTKGIKNKIYIWLKSWTKGKKLD